MKAVMYGAGNIGRGFIGQVFSQSDYETVFIDVNKEIVDKLNHDQRYPITLVSVDKKTEIWVDNVRAVYGRDLTAVAVEIASADIMATAVGVSILPAIVDPIASGIRKRWESGNKKPLNILLCENLLNANHYLSNLLSVRPAFV